MDIQNRSTFFSNTHLVSVLPCILTILLASPVYADNITYPGATPSNPGSPSVPGSIYPSIPSGNTVTINAGGTTIAGSIFGGIGGTSGISSTDNIVTMNGGRVNANVTGGWSLNSNALNNQVIIAGGRVDGFIYGGWVDGGIGAANLNRVSVTSGVTLTSNIYGAYVSGTGGANGNIVNISGGTMLGGIDIIAGGYSLSTGTASNNQVIISGGTMNGANIYGGRVNTSGDVLNNMVVITGGTIGENVYGGQLLNGNKLVSGNSVTITGGVVKGDVFGGAANTTGNTLNNEVTISGGTIISDVYGGKTGSGNSTGNTVTVSGSPIFSASTKIYGGSSGNITADAFTNNTFNIKTNEIQVATVGNFENYNFTLQAGLQSGDTVLQLTDAANLSNAKINAILAEVPIDMKIGDTVKLIATTDVGGLNTTGLTNVAGGRIGSSTSTGIWNYSSYADTSEVGLFFNTLTIDEFTQVAPYSITAGSLANQHVGLTVLGDFNAPDFIMTSNGVNGAALDISGTMKTSSLTAIAGSAGLSAKVGALDVTANDVSLNLTNTTAWDGTTGVLLGAVTMGNGRTLTLNGNGLYRLNTLNVMSDKTYYVGHLPATGAQLNFYLPGYLENGQTMLTLTGTADISGSNIAMGIPDEVTALWSGDRIALIRTTGGIVANGINSRASTLVGIARIYDFDLSTDSENLYASIPKDNILPYRPNPGLAALLGGQASGLGLLSNSNEFTMNQGMDALATLVEKDEIGPFIALGGSSLKYNIKGNLDVNSFNMLVGAGWKPYIANNQLTIGAFLEGGKGDYNTKNYFTNYTTVIGNGDTRYFGGGLVARYQWTEGVADGIYIEGAIRGGRVKNNFSTSDIGFGKQARYASSSEYYGAHSGIGYQWNFANESLFDFSAYYSWIYQGGDKVHIKRDIIDFKSVESHKIRLSGQYHFKINEQLAPYVGLAYEYEADGKIRATTHHMNIDQSDLKGSTGMIETGLRFKPSQNLPLQIEADIRGYTGKRKGFGGGIKLKYIFG